MSLTNCPECGKEISDKAKNCPNCGCPIGNNEKQLNQENALLLNHTTHITPTQSQTQKEPTENNKPSILSIFALIFSILGCTFWIGIILAIIDLIRKNGRKKTCSIISIAIGVIWILIAISISKGGEKEEIPKENITVEETIKNEESEEKTTNNSDKYIDITSTELIDSYNENQVRCKQNYDGKLIRVTGKVQSIGTDIMGNTYVCLGHDTDFTFVGIRCYSKDDETVNQIAELKEGDLITVLGKGECGSLSFSIKNAKIEEVAKETYIDESGEKAQITDNLDESSNEFLSEYYPSGQYKVGTDIDSGEYVFFTDSSNGYFCLSSDSNGKDIIANDNFKYNSIITIKDGEYLELSRCYAVPIEEATELPIEKATMFKIGMHIPAGEYKLISDNDRGYYCIYSDGRQNNIDSNDNFNGQSYVTVLDGQYLTLSRCHIEQ